MTMKNIADRLDAALNEATDQIQERRAQIVETDERRMAHHIVAYALESASAGSNPFDLGAAMVQGAVMGEDESGGVLAGPVVDFLSEMLRGAQGSLEERFGGDNISYDPVAHAVQYYCAHNKWPESATPGVISKARAAMAAGAGGSSKNKSSLGTFL